MSLITYEDKVALNENPQVADVNKVTADDMNQIKNAINNLFPVGFIIEVDNEEFDPNVSWGGTWERDKGHIIVSVDESDADFSTSGKTGGEKEVTLTLNEVPPHYHYLNNNGNDNTRITMNAISGGNNYNMLYDKADASENGPYVTTNYSGGGQPHNNMPPYRTAYRWIKTAM